MIKFKISHEYIELYKLLKATNLVATGGHGKLVIENGEVKLNGETEFRKRAKVRSGDIVEFDNNTIETE
jgi:ribosome-associated protein